MSTETKARGAEEPLSLEDKVAIQICYCRHVNFTPHATSRKVLEVIAAHNSATAAPGDTKRLDWLSDRLEIVDCSVSNELLGDYKWTDIRKAIDAAMAATAKEPDSGSAAD